MSRRLFIFITFLLTLLQSRAATEVSFRYYSTDDGLPTNYVINSVQDPRGYLWFSTRNGLCRFDGYKFHTFHYSTRGANTLPHSNLVRQVYQNPNGLLWIKFFGEVFGCYDTNRGRFVSYTDEPDDPRRLTECTILPNGDTWLWHNGSGALRVSYHDKKARSVMYNQQRGTTGTDNIHFVVEDSYHQVWIGTSKGVTLVQGDGGTILLPHLNILDCLTVGDALYLFCTDGSVYTTQPGGRVSLCYDTAASGNAISDIIGVARLGHKALIITRGDTYEYDTRLHTLVRSEQLQAPNAYVAQDNLNNHYIVDLTGTLHYIDSLGQIYELRIFTKSIQRENYKRATVANDDRGHLWIATQGNGLFVYDLSTRTAQHITSYNNIGSRIAINNLTSLLLDRQGNAWITLDNQGVVRASIVGREQQRIIPTHTPSESRSTEMLTLSREPDGSFLTSNHNHEVFRLRRQQGQWLIEPLFDVGDDNCRATLHAADGTIWAGTDYHGIRVGDRWYRHDDADPSSLGNNHVTHLYQDTAGRIWVACAGGGLDQAIPQGDGYRFRHFFDAGGLGCKVLTTYECPHGDFFVGTDKGIITFRPDELLADTSRYTIHFDRDADNWFDVHRILELPDGRIAYASTGAGVYISDSRDHHSISTFRWFTTNEGLPDMTCASMAVDADGMLWIGTQWGLARLNPTSGIVNRYNLSADHLGNVYPNGQGFLLGDGHLLFATGNGLLEFNPRAIDHMRRQTPMPYISDVLIGGIPLFEALDSNSTFDYQQELELRYNQNSLSFFFSCFDYGNEANIEYSFLLEGHDDGWSRPSTQSMVNYNSLEPGSYKLHIRSRDIQYGDSFTESVFTFTIHPPLWATWWAYLIYILVGLAILGVIIYGLRRHYKLKRELAFERRMTDFKSDFFMNISHELRTPLMLIQGSSERLQALGLAEGDGKQPMRNLRQSVSRLLRLTSQLLTFNKLQNDRMQLRLQQTEVVRMARDITTSFNDLAAVRRLAVTFNTTVSTLLMPLDRDLFDKMLHNLLSNAIKYTPDGGNISVRINAADGLFTISVTDDGIGIKPERKADLFERFARSTVAVDSIGIGLNLTYQLARLHHGHLSHADNPGGGSIFTITLSLGADSYSPDDWATHVVNDEAPAQPADAEYLEMPAVPLNDHRVVLAEDDPEVRHFLTRELGRFFTIVPTNDGQEALEEIQRQKPHLIISDLLMPRIDGIELLRRVRQDATLFDVPFVMLTAMDDTRHLMQGIKSGADSYIPKPVSIQLLATRCIKLLEQYERLRQSAAPEETVPAPAPILADEQDRKFRQVLDAKIELHLSDRKLNIDELGSAMGYHHSQFFSRVKEVTGLPPGEYIRRIKMERAAILLREETVTIAEVAYQLGFSDPLYFGRCFKQHYGKTPSQFRKGE